MREIDIGAQVCADLGCHDRVIDISAALGHIVPTAIVEGNGDSCSGT